MEKTLSKFGREVANRGKPTKITLDMLWPPSKKFGELPPNTKISTAQRWCAFNIGDISNMIKLMRITVFYWAPLFVSDQRERPLTRVAYKCLYIKLQTVVSLLSAADT